MKLVFDDAAWEEYLYWLEVDRKIVKRINLLIKDIQRDPYDGIGKPKRYVTIWKVTGRVV